MVNYIKSSSYKNHKLIILSSLIIPFLGAVGYSIFSNRTVKYFVICGIISVLTNISISIFYGINNKEKLGEVPDSNIVIIFYITTLIIPYSIFYILFAILLTGFHFLFYLIISG